MATIKSVCKIALFISVVLALGQVTIEKKCVGAHFVTGVKSGSEWVGRAIAESKFFASLPLPDFLKKWLPTAEKISPGKKLSEVDENLSSSDRAQVMQLLRN